MLATARLEDAEVVQRGKGVGRERKRGREALLRLGRPIGQPQDPWPAFRVYTQFAGSLARACSRSFAASAQASAYRVQSGAPPARLVRVSPRRVTPPVAAEQGPAGPVDVRVQTKGIRPIGRRDRQVKKGQRAAQDLVLPERASAPNGQTTPAHSSRVLEDHAAGTVPSRRRCRCVRRLAGPPPAAGRDPSWTAAVWLGTYPCSNACCVGPGHPPRLAAPAAPRASQAIISSSSGQGSVSRDAFAAALPRRRAPDREPGSARRRRARAPRADRRSDRHPGSGHVGPPDGSCSHDASQTISTGGL